MFIVRPILSGFRRHRSAITWLDKKINFNGSFSFLSQSWFSSTPIHLTAQPSDQTQTATRRIISLFLSFICKCCVSHSLISRLNHSNQIYISPTCMKADVYSEASLGREEFIAWVTFVLFGEEVDPLMGRQRALDRERSEAVGALERLLMRVNPYVTDEVARLLELLRTIKALMPSHPVHLNNI